MPEAQISTRIALSPSDPNSRGFRSLIDNVLGGQHPRFSLSERCWVPPADVFEAHGNVVVKMEIAGGKPADLEVAMDKDLLIIRGSRSEEPIAKEDYHLMEIRYGRFERAFRMPRSLDLPKAQARYEQGFLLISIPKRVEEPRSIEVRVVE